MLSWSQCTLLRFEEVLPKSPANVVSAVCNQLPEVYNLQQHSPLKERMWAVWVPLKGGSSWGACWAVQWSIWPGALCQTSLKMVCFIHPVPATIWPGCLEAKWSFSFHSTSLRITLSPAVYFQFPLSRCSLRLSSFLPVSPAMSALFSVEEALKTIH